MRKRWGDGAFPEGSQRRERGAGGARERARGPEPAGPETRSGRQLTPAAVGSHADTCTRGGLWAEQARGLTWVEPRRSRVRPAGGAA